ncbi:MAG: GNAT family protein [Opitutaceae bacterium]|jgi:ribosomal-protein-alanine N-acetyltransferase
MADSLDYPVTFETARLRARRPRVEDAPAVLAAYAGDPEVTRYLSWCHYTEAAPLTVFLSRCVEAWTAKQGHLTYLLYAKDAGDALVGSIGMERDGGKVVFGYVLGRPYWGRGYTTEALRHLSAWALAQPGIFRIWAFCDVANPASARVMEKAGLEREGLLRRWHVCPELGSEPRDCLIYSKVR